MRRTNCLCEEVLTALERRAYRRPVTAADLQDLLPFYTAGRAERDFDLGIQRALERLLVSRNSCFASSAHRE